jgi:predicted 3-demethylubiquinone-9 3-methyltransferase (glyoxalase superfamily)
MMSSFQDNPRITPFLWFETNAEEAVDFYLSVFKNSRRLQVQPNEINPKAPHKILTITFELDGQRFIALNGGPYFKFNESVSFMVRCDSQQEVDEYWRKFIGGGGVESQCGWLKDKFGVSWQITPAHLPELIQHPKALEAMMKMKKIDIGELERAAKE